MSEVVYYDLRFANGMFMHVPLVSGMGQTGRLDQIGDSFTDNIKLFHRQSHIDYDDR